MFISISLLYQLLILQPLLNLLDLKLQSILSHREVVTDLIEEYKAAERPDYVTWGGSSSVSGGGERERTSSTNVDTRMREELGDRDDL